MAAQLIDGKAIAAKVRQRIGEKVAELRQGELPRPGGGAGGERPGQQGLTSV